MSGELRVERGDGSFVHVLKLLDEQKNRPRVHVKGPSPCSHNSHTILIDTNRFGVVI